MDTFLKMAFVAMLAIGSQVLATNAVSAIESGVSKSDASNVAISTQTPESWLKVEGYKPPKNGGPGRTGDSGTRKN